MPKYKCPKCCCVFDGPAAYCPACGQPLRVPEKTVVNGHEVKCPICGGTHIIKCDYSMGANQSFFTLIPTSGFGYATAVRYICEDCGYLLQFVDSSEIPTIRAKFKK